MTADPAGGVASVFVHEFLDVSVVRDGHRVFRACDLPRISIKQPFIGSFDLFAVLEVLLEDAEFVADTIAKAR